MVIYGPEVHRCSIDYALRLKLISGRDILEAKFERGKSKNGKVEDAFLVCHGFGGSMFEPEESSVMSDLVRMGHPTLLVSHRTGKTADLIFHQQVRQLIDAITYLKGSLGARRVHIFGISMGAANAVNVAALDARVSSVVASSGISDCRLWLQQRLGTDFDQCVEEATKRELAELKGGSRKLAKKTDSDSKKLFEVTDLLRIPETGGIESKVKGRITKVSGRTVRSLLTYRPILAAPGIPKDTPAFFFHGTGDELVSHKHTLALYEAAGSQKKHKLLIEGGSHGMILDPTVR